jgi:hypothetical protein
MAMKHNLSRSMIAPLDGGATYAARALYRPRDTDRADQHASIRWYRAHAGFLRRIWH